MLFKPLSGEKWFDIGYNEVAKKKWPLTDSVYANALKRADKLLRQDVQEDGAQTHASKKSEEAWLATVIEKGTMSDRLSAVQLRFQKNPIYSLENLERIVAMIEKRKMRDAINLLKCLKEILIKELLPSARKLVAFDMRPLDRVDELSSGNATTANRRLVLWLFEDKLKKLYERICVAAQKLASNPVEGVAQQSCIVIADLLIERPELEQFLLQALVNKIGHPKKKIDVTVTKQVERLLDRHPNMRLIVATELERLIFKKNIAERTQFYAVHTLTLIRLSSADVDLALKLLRIYFSLFRILIDKKKTEGMSARCLSLVIRGANNAFPYAKQRTSELGVELDELYKIVHTATKLSTALSALKLLYQMLSYNVSLTDRFYATFYQRMLRIRSTNADVQFFHLLYQVLLADVVDVRVRAFIKRLMQMALHNTPSFAAAALMVYGNLLKEKPALKRLPRDANTAPLPPLTNGLDDVKLEIKKEEGEEEAQEPVKHELTNGARSPITLDDDDDDEEERYVDVPLEEDENKMDVKPLESQQTRQPLKRRRHERKPKPAAAAVAPQPPTKGWIHREKLASALGKSRQSKSAPNQLNGDSRMPSLGYDPNCRNPVFAHADMSSDTELMLLARHYHPSVSHFATCIIEGKKIHYKGNPLMDFTLMRFLDRFAFKNPKLHKTDEEKSPGRTKYEPRGVKSLAPSSIEYASKKVNEVPWDERFLHRFVAMRMAQKQTPGEESAKAAAVDDQDDVSSVASDEFDLLMSKFEPGEANENFDWEDVDFAQEFGDELEPRLAKARRKQKRRGLAKADAGGGDGASDEGSDAEGALPTSDMESDDGEASDGSDEEEERGGGGGVESNAIESGEDEDDENSEQDEEDDESASGVSGGAAGVNDFIIDDSSDDEDEFKAKRIRKIPKRGFDEVAIEDDD